MARSYVHTLRFGSLGELSRSFEELLESEAVEDCLVEPGEFRLRFLAAPHIARKFVERIYLFGGLTWYSSHPIELGGEEAFATGRSA